MPYLISVHPRRRILKKLSLKGFNFFKFYLNFHLDILYRQFVSSKDRYEKATVSYNGDNFLGMTSIV